LNHGSYGSCPKVILDEQRRWIEKLEEQPVLFFRELAERMKISRAALSSYFHTKPENITYVTNATYAVNVVAQALAKSILKPGDEILTTD
jgi:isopenicillin-N epimerase